MPIIHVCLYENKPVSLFSYILCVEQDPNNYCCERKAAALQMFPCSPTGGTVHYLQELVYSLPYCQPVILLLASTFF